MPHLAAFLRPLLAAAAALLSACAGHAPYPPPSECPQPRFTGRAPEAVYQRTNPLPATAANVDAGHDLFEDVEPRPCALCHGVTGDGRGFLAEQFDPPPRNFACAETINGIPDGQLYWIIRNGSPGTAMPAYRRLDEEQTWQLVMYLRALAR